IISLWKSLGLDVGFTNGCFDLLHRGHLHSLDHASQCADKLVVGLNSDASAARLKGPDRPVQDEATRAAILAALRYVDLVVVFDDDTPEALIRALKPDVLAKGADYEGRDIPGAAFVTEQGGRVVLLPLLDGFSTTRTIAQIEGDVEA
ncbi:MAG: adenylyltransferase/cytidyltransferase family protein, partial [Alphaproteobacteria bacterium]